MHAKGFAKIVLLCGLVLNGWACEPQNGIGNAVHRDSAGIHITENSDAPDRESPWIVDPEPSVEIGVVEGDPPYQLFTVTDAARLSDGSIVVVNAGTRELRIYDPNGTFTRALGGAGDGPGEFRYIGNVVVLSGDTILTRDSRKQAWFLPSGDLIREQTIDRSRYSAQAAYPLASGQLLAELWAPYDPKPGVYRQGLGFALIEPPSERVDTLGWYGALDNFIRREGDRLIPFSLPFGRITWWALGTDRVYLGDNDRFEVHAFGLDGLMRQIIRLDRAGNPVTEADRAEYQDQAMELASERGAEAVTQFNRFFSEVEWPSTKPAFGRLYTDTENNLWVKHYRWDYAADAPYDVFDTTGVFLGTVTLPDGVEPLEIGTDYLIGLWRDESDVEFVRVYRMSRQ
jgi:hypothetical protein